MSSPDRPGWISSGRGAGQVRNVGRTTIRRQGGRIGRAVCILATRRLGREERTQRVAGRRRSVFPIGSDPSPRPRSSWLHATAHRHAAIMRPWTRQGGDPGRRRGDISASPGIVGHRSAGRAAKSWHSARPQRRTTYRFAAPPPLYVVSDMDYQATHVRTDEAHPEDHPALRRGGDGARVVKKPR